MNITRTTFLSGNPNDPDEQKNLGEEDGDLELSIRSQLEKAQADVDKYMKNDKNMKRKDTVEVMVHIMSRIKSASESLN